MPEIKWAYGVTTTKERLGDTLPRTLGSLLRGGFPQPRLFIDGTHDIQSYEKFGLEMTLHYPTIRVYGNWALGLHELYYRNPTADIFAMFQDDIVVATNIREYLEKTATQKDCYYNLYTTPENEKFANGAKGWFASNQQGRGALALILHREFVLTLLSDRRWLDRPQEPNRGHKVIDGGIAHSMSSRYYGKYTEMCHIPSLVQHTGNRSTIGNAINRSSGIFAGEDFNALSLIPTKEDPVKEPEVSDDKPPENKDADQVSKPGIPQDHSKFSSAWALGDDVAFVLDSIGITKERVSQWLGRTCTGCWERQRRLNQLGWLCKKALSGSIDEVKSRFEEILND